MPLKQSDIAPGVVAWFDTAALNADRLVQKSAAAAAGDDGQRPFLCLAAAGGTSTWTPLSTELGTDEDQFAIGPEWRTGGSPKWRTGSLFLNARAITYVGPDSSFVAAAARERPQKLGRPTIANEGVEAVRAQIRQHGGHLS